MIQLLLFTAVPVVGAAGLGWLFTYQWAAKRLDDAALDVEVARDLVGEALDQLREYREASGFSSERDGRVIGGMESPDNTLLAVIETELDADAKLARQAKRLARRAKGADLPQT